eukprot:4462192-Ditylum_brightwellii.AAC.1
MATKSDPDVYLKPAVMEDGTKHYSYIVVYVDSILIKSKRTREYMDMLALKYCLKGVVGNPTMYLGRDIQKWKTENVINAWATSPDSCFKEAVWVMETHMKKDGKQPVSRVDCKSEFEESRMCDDQETRYYQNLVGMLSIIPLPDGEKSWAYASGLTCLQLSKHHKTSWLMMDPSTLEVMWQGKPGERSPQEKVAALKKLCPDVIDEIPNWVPKP